MRATRQISVSWPKEMAEAVKAFTVDEGVVSVIGILCGGQDGESPLRDEPAD